MPKEPTDYSYYQGRSPAKLSYQGAGVNIDRGSQLVEMLKPSAAATYGRGVMGKLGGFGALFDIGALDFKDPILVTATDGVGTKLKLAIEAGRHDTVGIDLVAMCVNDVLVQGASPLFFLDYFACAELDLTIAGTVIKGIAEGCQLANCALIGGETAEMPGMYTLGDYDLAGFCVGAVERDQIIDGRAVQDGDVLIAIASSGPHANGYTLIRQILKQSGTSLGTEFCGGTLGQILLEPTRIYAKAIKQLLQAATVKALAHITGGGLIDNIPRVLPKQVQTVIDTQSWSWPPVFKWLQTQGNIESHEMHRTFNCGVGMVVCVAKETKNQALAVLTEAGERVWEVGRVETSKGNTALVNFI